MHLGLTNFTSGKGKSDQKDSGMRPIEIFMCSVVSQCAVLLWTICQACMLGRRQGDLSKFVGCWPSPQLEQSLAGVCNSYCNPAQGTARALQPIACVQVRRMGYGEGFRWLSQYIK